MPFNAHLGLHVKRVHADGLTLECAVRPEMMNGAGMLHGGVTATLADAALGIAVLGHFGGKRKATTVELKLNYLRPIVGGRVVARSKLVRVGQTLVTGTVEIKDGQGKLAAVALLTYMLLPAHS